MTDNPTLDWEVYLSPTTIVSALYLDPRASRVEWERTARSLGPKAVVKEYSNQRDDLCPLHIEFSGMRANAGDWLVRDEDGTLSVMMASRFVSSYLPADSHASHIIAELRHFALLHFWQGECARRGIDSPYAYANVAAHTDARIVQAVTSLLGEVDADADT